MKILIIGDVEYQADNAAALRVLEVVKVLVSQGNEVEVIDYMGENSTKQDLVIARHAKVHQFAPPKSLMRRFLVKLGRGFSLLDSDQIVKGRWDVVYCYGSSLSWVIAGWLLAKHSRARLVADVTEFYDTEDMFKSLSFFRSRIGSWIGLLIFIPLLTSAIAVPSNYFRRIMKKFQNNLIILPPFFSELTVARSGSLNGGRELTLVYAGMPSGKEHFEPLFRSLLDLPENLSRTIRIQLVGVSDNILDKMLADCSAATLRWRRNIVIEALGRVDAHSARRIVAGADFAIVLRKPSLRVNCGFPSKIAEAFCLGIPIISNDYSDVSRYLKNGVNGFLLETGSIEETRTILLHCLTLDKDSISRMAEQSRSTGRNMFSAESASQPIRQLIGSSGVGGHKFKVF